MTKLEKERAGKISGTHVFVENTAMLRRRLKKWHLPFEMRGNSACSGFNCKIDMPTIQFHSTIHKDKR